MFFISRVERIEIFRAVSHSQGGARWPASLSASPVDGIVAGTGDANGSPELLARGCPGLLLSSSATPKLASGGAEYISAHIRSPILTRESSG